MALSADDLIELADYFRILLEIERELAFKEVIRKSIIPNIIVEETKT